MASPDIEDIISIIDGNDDLDEILVAPTSAKNYIVQSFANLLKNDDFKRSISGHLGFETTASERAKEVTNKMAKII